MNNDEAHIVFDGDTELDALSIIANPLLPGYALQHDLRERFLHALVEIINVEPEPRAYRAAFLKCQEIARGAVDVDSITEWVANGRPLPWLDEVLGEAAKELTDAVVALSPSI